MDCLDDSLWATSTFADLGPKAAIPLPTSFRSFGPPETRSKTRHGGYWDFSPHWRRSGHDDLSDGAVLMPQTKIAAIPKRKKNSPINPARNVAAMVSQKPRGLTSRAKSRGVLDPGLIPFATPLRYSLRAARGQWIISHPPKATANTQTILSLLTTARFADFCSEVNVRSPRRNRHSAWP